MNGGAAVRSVKSNAAAIAAGVLFAVLLQFVLRGVMGPFVSKVMLDIGINIILALSLNIVNGFTGQFSIGHAGFMAVGGYAAAAITYYGSLLLWGSAAIHGDIMGPGDMLFLGACGAGGCAAALAGLVVGLPSLRLRGDYLAIVTLGFGEIIRVLIQQTGDVLLTADEVRSASPGTVLTSLGGSLGFPGIPFYTNLFWVWIWVAVTLAAVWRLKYSGLGRAFLSIREDELAAEAMGVPTTRVKVTAFVISAFFAGIAGALFAHLVGTTLNPGELGFQKSFDIIIMVVLGGMGSISGSIIAAIVLTILPEALRAVADYRMIAYAVFLIALMIWRPSGLFGVRELWELGPFRRRGEAKPS
ncbi:MAG: hypothetical protein GMKNLPBB_00244 [Myxococcota bacterium]|nr:hypothetical protein [Myxococcota bacterium]